MAEVLEPEWQVFTTRFPLVATVDELLRLHGSFINNCLTGMLINSYPLLHALTSLLLTCLQFAEKVQDMMEKADFSGQVARLGVSAEESSSFQRTAKKRMPTEEELLAEKCVQQRNHKRRVQVERSRLLASMMLSSAYTDMLNTSSAQFDVQLSKFIERLVEAKESASQIEQLLTRLDYNNFFSRQALSRQSSAAAAAEAPADTDTNAHIGQKEQ
eukprot:gb/GEZN01018750.1/.p1 GENE.gb/GEZN01018750.1/~~gb/GEZN01018750.1/.p1  ORF type:complete len:247 (-),score=40.75 gb/GEZN01018750.1/:3-647(-)